MGAAAVMVARARGAKVIAVDSLKGRLQLGGEVTLVPDDKSIVEAGWGKRLESSERPRW